MNNDYSDIRDQLGPPIWWDEHAVPRYCEFSPRETANIYAHEVCLLVIQCQSCGYEFKVAMSQNAYGWNELIRAAMPTLAEQIEHDTIHYGDPPNAGCCPSGATMNSIPIRVLQFWQRMTIPPSRLPEWVSVPGLERSLRPSWRDA